jgi:hypothetical protein
LIFPLSDCKQILTDLTLVIRHNGTSGIFGIEAFFETGDAEAEDGSFTQRFAYTHFWISDNRYKNPQLWLGE